jgi:hypothetical protein
VPALAFTDQRGRLRSVLQNALTGSTYEATRREEDFRTLVLEGRRADGRLVGVRFRGVRDSEASRSPDPGSALRLRSVGSADRFSFLGLLFPFARPTGFGFARVRIDAGDARLDIVCQDAEWWEDETPGPPAESEA